MRPRAPVRSPRLDVSRYRGQWLALHPETHEVVGHGPTLKDAQKRAAKKGILHPALYPVPKSDAYFVGKTRPPRG